MKFIILAALATTATVAALPQCAKYDEIVKIANQGEGARCVVQSGFHFLSAVDPKSSLKMFCENPRCSSAWSRISSLVTEECLIDNFNIKKDLLDVLEDMGACDPPPDCANAEEIYKISKEGEGARCNVQSGLNFMLAVDPNRSFKSFCANPLCTSAWSRISSLVTEECLINGFNIKTDVLDVLEEVGACDLVPDCENSDEIRKIANQGEGGRCVVQTGFSFLTAVEPGSSLDAFCANPLCSSAWSRITPLVSDECLVDGVNIKADVLDMIRGACDDRRNLRH